MTAGEGGREGGGHIECQAPFNTGEIGSTDTITATEAMSLFSSSLMP